MESKGPSAPTRPRIARISAKLEARNATGPDFDQMDACSTGSGQSWSDGTATAKSFTAGTGR
jgi:hypothetical protein